MLYGRFRMGGEPGRWRCRLGLRLLWAGLLLASASADAVAQSPLAEKIDGILARGQRSGVRMGVRVMDLPSGRVLYSVRAESAFVPASNMKIVTSAAALDLLGAEFTYRTILARRGDDLIIVGSGDPATGDPVIAGDKGEPITAIFHNWAEALKRAGITEVPGRLLIDDSVFESQRTHPSWHPEELDSWFAAPVGGLNFNDNCIDTEVWPAEKTGEDALYELTPRTTTVAVENHCKSGAKGRPFIRRLPGKDVLVLTGACSKPTSIAPVAVHDPGMLFAGACRMALVASGVRIGTQFERVRVRQPDGSLPDDCTIIATHTSSLDAILKRCNKRSQNLFAECLLKTLGYVHGCDLDVTDAPVGSWTTGRAAVRRFLMKVGVSPSECVIDDGSGLSHDNRLTPMQLTEILRYMYDHPNRSMFVASLAVSGRDGTIRRRMTDIAGQVHAKTGYVSGSRTLSGYVSDKAGKRWACFSILVNGIRGSTRPYADIQDDVVRCLAQYLEASKGSD